MISLGLSKGRFRRSRRCSKKVLIDMKIEKVDFSLAFAFMDRYCACLQQARLLYLGMWRWLCVFYIDASGWFQIHRVAVNTRRSNKWVVLCDDLLCCCTPRQLKYKRRISRPPVLTVPSSFYSIWNSHFLSLLLWSHPSALPWLLRGQQRYANNRAIEKQYWNW